MPESGPNKKILIIEDDIDIREALTEILADEGFEVRSAAHGADGLEALRSGFVPRLILLDLMMPVMNGWQFSAEQKKEGEFKDIPVVVISADGNLSEKVKDIAAVDCLKKPIQLLHLLDIANRYCSPLASPQ
jgi:CheY-like chemotaxis protein